jgi:hypothetical protein
LFAQQNKLIVSPPDSLMVKRGSHVIETLKVDVLPGFHVNNDHPRDEFLIPLTLKWEGGPMKATGFHFPKAEEIQVGADHLLVFTGKFDIKTDFAVDANAPVGSTTVTGKLRYQACSNQMCFRPATLEVKLPVTVE